MLTKKNFIKKDGSRTNLCKVVETILYNNNYCQRKYLTNLFNNWQSLDYVLTNYNDCFLNKKEGMYSFFSITPECYDVYASAMFDNDRRPYRYTDILDKYKTEDKEEPEKDNIHYVHYDMEVESMDFKTAKQILNENGFLLEDK